jgi:hypothetical protein
VEFLPTIKNLLPGSPEPLGPNVLPEGINFAIHSAGATRIELPETGIRRWYRVVDSSLPCGEDAVSEEEAFFLPETTYLIQPRSTIVLVTREPRQLAPLRRAFACDIDCRVGGWRAGIATKGSTGKTLVHWAVSESRRLVASSK